MNDKEAIKEMKNWVEYEKANKEKIIKADELIEIQETVLNLIEKYKNLYRIALNNTIKSDRELLTLKRDFEIVGHECFRLKQEEIKKDKQIEQYQNMLATNDMLHVLECEKKDKIIDLMAQSILNYDDQLVINRYKNKEHVIETFVEYFENKVKESK